MTPCHTGRAASVSGALGYFSFVVLINIFIEYLVLFLGAGDTAVIKTDKRPCCFQAYIVGGGVK